MKSIFKANGLPDPPSESNTTRKVYLTQNWFDNYCTGPRKGKDRRQSSAVMLHGTPMQRILC